MPIKVLPKDEVAQMFQPQARVDLNMFTQALEQLGMNEWGVIEPMGGTTMKLIKRRLNQAAKKLGIRVRYKARPDNAPGVAIAKKLARA